MKRVAWLLATTLFLLGPGPGCGEAAGVDSPVVGGSCRGPEDCVLDSTCYSSKDFPGGLCSFDCRDTRDCPARSACIDAKDGICLLTCARHDDCREGYKCDDKSLEGESGRALVCVKD